MLNVDILHPSLRPQWLHPWMCPGALYTFPRWPPSKDPTYSVCVLGCQRKGQAVSLLLYLVGFGRQLCRRMPFQGECLLLPVTAHWLVLSGRYSIWRLCLGFAWRWPGHLDTLFLNSTQWMCWHLQILVLAAGHCLWSLWAPLGLFCFDVSSDCSFSLVCPPLIVALFWGVPISQE